MTGRHRSPEPRPPPRRWPWIAAGALAVATSLAAMHYGDAISVHSKPAAPPATLQPVRTWPTPAPVFPDLGAPHYEPAPIPTAPSSTAVRRQAPAAPSSTSPPPLPPDDGLPTGEPMITSASTAPPTDETTSVSAGTACPTEDREHLCYADENGNAEECIEECPGCHWEGNLECEALPSGCDLCDPDGLAAS